MTDVLSYVAWLAFDGASIAFAMGIAAWLTSRRHYLAAILIAGAAVIVIIHMGVNVVWTLQYQRLIDWAQSNSVDLNIIFGAHQVLSAVLRSLSWALLFAGALADRGLPPDLE